MSEDSTPYKTAEPDGTIKGQPGYPTQPYTTMVPTAKPAFGPEWKIDADPSRITNDACPVNANGLASKLAGQPANTVIAVCTGSAEMDLILLIKAALESVPVDANTFERVSKYITQSLYRREKSPFTTLQSLAASFNQSEHKNMVAGQQASERDKQLLSDRIRSELRRTADIRAAGSRESEDGAKAGVK